MHYNWQILVKAENADDAISNAEQVLNDIGGNGVVWDWWEIGGRWELPENAINATHKDFHKRLRGALRNQAQAIKSALSSVDHWLEKETPGATLQDVISGRVKNHMVIHCLHTLCELRNGYYNSESYLATDGDIWGSPEVIPEVKCKIWDNPEDYWLVNVDIHN